MTQVKGKLNRRRFLLAVGAGGAATVAAVVTSVAKSPVPAKVSTTGSGKRATRGYAASEHIDNYYRTTKV
jgi:hypothetical protein